MIQNIQNQIRDGKALFSMPRNGFISNLNSNT